MMDISLLISGNLTGFGRFYTSPAAAELLGNEKISLDNHSHLTFLGDKEKAYSITFAQRYIVISQYTQILDSFRRPGKLVVSLIIPRNYTIVPNTGSSKGTVYSLLTKISDKFFEKNFQDGMINQNPAVLGQDYYSVILDGYTLMPSDNRRINENPSSVKKVGYVRAAETEIPNYLDTPYRKSYGEGEYNLVFFAPSAPVGMPNSIDEEPDEVILYKVRILNTGTTLPNPVKLSSPIYNLQAKRGEKQFRIEGTYNDVINHLKEPQITGRIIPGEIIEIQYNFEKEERTVKFVFVDMSTTTPVNLDMVLPSILYADGSKQPISSDTFTFRGSEIFDDKKLVADNPAISISPRSERLDLLHLSDNQELKVYVQQGFNLPVDPYFTNLTFTFVNINTGEKRQFSKQRMIHLPGCVTDWNVYVDTEMYFAPLQSLAVQNGKWKLNNLQKKDRKPESPVKSSNTTISVQSKKPTFTSASQSSTQYVNDFTDNGRNNWIKWRKYLFFIPILILVFGVGWWAYEEYVQKTKQQSGDGDVEIVETPEKRWCYLIYYDNSDRNRDTIEVCRDEKSSKHYSNYSFMLLDEDKKPLTKDDDYLLQPSDTFANSKQYFRQKLTISDNCNSKTFYIRVSYLCGENFYQIVDGYFLEDILTTHGTQSVNLGILRSQLGWYKALAEKSEFENIEEKERWSEDVKKLNYSDYQQVLLLLVKNKNVKKPSDSSSGQQKRNPTNPLSKKDPDWDLLNSPQIKRAQLQNYRGYESHIIGEGVTVGERIDAIKTTLICINGEYKYGNGTIQNPGVDTKKLKLSEDQMSMLQSVLTLTGVIGSVPPKKYASIKEFYDDYRD